MPNSSQNISKILDLAQNEATNRGNQHVTIEDLFAGILQEENSIMDDLFNELKCSRVEMLSTLRHLANSSLLNKLKEKIINRLPYDLTVKTLINNARNECDKLNEKVLTAPHLFLAITQEESLILSQIWQKYHLKYDLAFASYQAIIAKLGSKTPFLDKFGLDLVSKARLKELNPIVGRFDEIAEIIQILSRKEKNNPVLYGEAGVGKTAIVEGIAIKIAGNDIPDNLKNKKIIELSLNSILAGTGKRGEYEERLDKIIKEVKNSNGEIILFIDEIHTLVKSEETEETANILKPALARGEIQTIGATTVAEYHRYFEKDAAFERRFQPVYIDEPTSEECFFIIQGVKEKYEKFHRISIPDDLIAEAINLSQRYLTNRFLPDKAFDLIDESCSLCKAPDITVNEKLQAWQKIKTYHEGKAAEARQNQNNFLYETEIQKITALDNEIKNLQNKKEILSRETNQKILSPEFLRQIISRRTGIPPSYLQESEQQRILTMEEKLNEQVIGQKEAVGSLAAAILRNRAGLNKKDRPIGSFIFMGKTGVGKTELAEALTSYLFGTKEALLRFDMSEYMEKHTVSKLIGAPPGYIGYEEGGQLTKKIQIRPYSVILFDEIEKANPEVLNILLQILDEGALTDNQGRHINFKNTIIICTSNLGSENLNPSQLSTLSDADKKKTIVNELKKHLKIELINRFDDIIFFNPLSPENLLLILDLLLKETKSNLSEKNLELEITDSAKQKLIEKGYDPDLGARPLKYVIQHEIETPLARLIISRQIKEKNRIICDFKIDQFTFEIK